MEEEIGKVGEFITTKGYFYKGKVLSETATHYRIYDFKEKLEFDLLKTTKERIKWIEVV